MKLPRFEVIVFSYILIGVITFGHAYNTIEVIPSGTSMDQLGKTAGALLAGMAWPMYLSVHLWED